MLDSELEQPADERIEATKRSLPSAEAGPVSVTVAGHHLTVFVETWPLIEAMVRDILAARKRVWLETYIFQDDAAGQAIAAALRERVAAGVQVRVLYDFIGSSATSGAFFRDLEEAGVQVHAFHSLWEALWNFSFLRILNRRNHRKLLVLDDATAYFGGMNLVDTTLGGRATPEELPASAGWRDVHLRLTGPQQNEIAESFERSWRMAHGEPIARRPRSYRLGVLAAAEESIQFFDSGPGLRHSRAARLFTRLIRAARRRITFSMAYFLPVGGVLRELLRAPRRGVPVRVVVPGESDVPLVQHASRHLYTRLLARRIRIYERQASMLHSKVMIVDNTWAVVGSCNLDARSLYINFEFLAVIRSRSLARVLMGIVRQEIAHSKRVTLEQFRERNWWRWFVNRLAWSLRWWL
ncbi:MAG TPA: phospholipase D-like domain-containing protein [Gemmataceae bacterium]|nr:phospholipase D-like domain-containing protein [Gemmataceae bacterium]